MKNLILLLTLTLSAAANAQSPKKSLKSQFDSLGDNQIIAERVKNLNSEQKVRIVQNRLVDRNLRLELGLGYGFVSGGDSYVNTQDLNGLAEFHINPRWSLGVRHQKSYNKLTPEGRNQYDKALAAQKQDAGSNFTFSAIDYPLEATYGTISFYPIYGKLNLFDLSVAHFDFYLMAGYGNMKLSSGSTNATTGGGGVGIWLSQRFSTRFELRYQSYKDLIGTGNRNQSSVEGMASIGFLL
jgi:outer membrane beta-barrel protein